MRQIFRVFVDLVDDVDFWLPLAGLVLIGAGAAVTLLHLLGTHR